ncbi:MAG: PcfJ domain-containing protein [Syntrophaceae bacterium]|nr:PcfJ domain-containing protein [Syntrophaceae bacterium]
MGKYRFIDHHSNGRKSFIIEADNRTSVEFGIQHNLLYVEECKRGDGHFKLHAYQAWARSICQALWKGDCIEQITRERRERGEKPRMPWGGMRKWVYNQTGKCIGARLHEKWLELLDTVDPTIREIDKKLFAATFKPYMPDVSAYKIANNVYLLADVLKYPAAAIAADCAFKLSAGLPEKHLAKSLETNRSGCLAAYMAEDWKRLFSTDGETYTSLNRTLMNLPRQVPPGLLRSLQKIKLSRPVTNRTQLIALLCGTSQGWGQNVIGWRNWQEHDVDPLEVRNAVRHRFNLVQNASPEQFKKIVEIIGDYTHNHFKHTKTSDIYAVMNFINDCPVDRMHGSLTGWARRAVEYHRNELRERLEREAQIRDPKTPLARPPIDPPTHPSIKFLATVQDLLDEGALMDHCIGGYAGSAINGASFLFHVDHKNEAASVEVDDVGKVLQSWGPSNKKNSASQWGQKMLSSWGRKFPNHGEKSKRHGSLDLVLNDFLN